MHGVPLVGRAYPLEVREVRLHNLLAAGGINLGEVLRRFFHRPEVQSVDERAREDFRAVGAVGLH